MAWYKWYYTIFVVFWILFFLIFGLACSAQFSTNEEKKATGLWGVIKPIVGKPIAYANEKVNILIGYRTEEGDILLCSSSTWKQLGRFLGFAAAISIWVFLFYLIREFSTWRMGAWIARPSSMFGRLILFITMYSALGIVPITNRLLQILSLEFTGVNWVIRSFIWGAIIFFAPKFYKDYIKYKRRKDFYDKKLKEEAGKEILRAITKA